MPTTDTSDTDSNNNPVVAASPEEPPRTGTDDPPPPSTEDLTVEPDRDQIAADAADRMREMRDDLAEQFLETDRERRRFKAGTEALITDMTGGNWRNPHTYDRVSPGDRPPLFFAACLAHLQNPVNNLASSLKYTLKRELDPANQIPADSEAATARARESRADGRPRSEDPVNADALERVGARVREIPRPEQRMDRQIRLAREFRERDPAEYDRIRERVESEIRDRYTAGQLAAMPPRILEGEVLNAMHQEIEERQETG